MMERTGVMVDARRSRLGVLTAITLCIVDVVKRLESRGLFVHALLAWGAVGLQVSDEGRHACIAILLSQLTGRYPGKPKEESCMREMWHATYCALINCEPCFPYANVQHINGVLDPQRHSQLSYNRPYPCA